MNKEDIDCWNDIFKNGRIQESDLKQPTELFLVRTFVAYLQKFGFKVEPPSLDADSREKRSFLIRLAKNIDRILKYTKESYACYYSDIISPVPKRTGTLLSILLNYYYFYTMFADDVSKIEEAVVQKREGLKREFKKLKHEHEEQKERALQLRDESEKLTNALPATRKEIEIYTSNIKEVKEALPQIETEVQQLQEKLNNLQTREVFLKSQIVNDEGVEALKTELEGLHNNIGELDLQKQTLEFEFKDFMAQTTKMSSLCKSVEAFKVMMPEKELCEFEQVMEKIKENEIQHSNLRHEVEAMANASNTVSTELATITDELKSKKRTFEQQSRDLLNIMANCQKQLAKERNRKNDLTAALADVEHLMDEQKIVYEYLINFIESVMSKYKNVKQA